MNQLKFADRITMHELNPHNFALKNDYISNLVSTALNVLPYANASIGSSQVRVTRGFLSKSYIDQELDIPKRKQEDMYKHSQGLALEITWDNFEIEQALELVNYILSPITGNNEKMKIVIDTLRNKMSFYFNTDSTLVEEETSEGSRVIRS